ncbi:hypothetical protein L7F22_006121 [Adiantum nelumboides]|nr:hypothetical protein [Adiantum nelumboides]
MRAGVSCSGDAGAGQWPRRSSKVYQEMRETMMIWKTWAATVLVISLVSSCRQARCSSMNSLLQYGAAASRAAGDEAAETPATQAEPPASEAEDSEPPAQKAGEEVR